MIRRLHAMVVIATAMTLLPGLARAQSFANPNPRNGGACNGFVYRVHLRTAQLRMNSFQAVGYPVVTAVDSLSAAATAGVMPDDSLVTVNGRPVIDDPRILSLPAGARMALGVKRGAGIMEFVFRVGTGERDTSLAYDPTATSSPPARCVSAEH